MSSCHVILGIAVSTLGFSVWVKEKEKGLAAVVKGNTNTYLMGLPHGSPLPFLYPSAPTNNPSTL
jgi:hypothetical protein